VSGRRADRLTPAQLGRGRRLAGADVRAAEIAENLGCTLHQARALVRARNRRIKAGAAFWFDRGQYPPRRK